MKLTILKDHLNQAIQHVSKAITNHTSIPILSGIKIDADAQGVTLTASDSDISIQSFIAAEQEDLMVIELFKNGSVVLPARFFIEIIRKLPDSKIEIEVKELFHTTIRSGSSEIQMIGLDPEEYPSLPSIEQSQMIQIPSDLLKMMIRQTSFAVSTSETTPILTGVLWTLKEQELKLIACDRHRLALRDIQMPHGDEQTFNNIVISGKTLNELNKILPDASDAIVEILVSNNQVLFKINQILFFTRILDGIYPDTSKLIPQQFQTEFVLHNKSFIDAIDRAYLLSREDKTNIVRMIMKEDQTIEISSSSTELGKVTETIPIESVSGELLRISFNSKYMLDALKVFDSDKIKFGFTGPMSPIIIYPEHETNLLQLILPYRTTN